MPVMQDFHLRYRSALSDKAHPLSRFALRYSREPIILSDITWPTAATLVYGQVLGDSVLSGGSARTDWGTTIEGSFEWQSPSTVLNAGSHNPTVLFVPDRLDFYSIATGQTAITVNKATPTISVWPSASTITYGQTLANSSLTGGSASVGGTFAWVSPTTAPNAGTHSYSVRFTPTDTANYNTVTSSVNIIVNKATPTIVAWPTTNPIVYGQSLSSVTYATSGSATGVGGNPLAGSFGWVNPSVIPSSSGNQSGRFTPTDTTNYNLVDGNVYVYVIQTITTTWTTRTSGQTSVIDLTGKTLYSAKIQWRGSSLQGPSEQSVYNRNSGSLKGPFTVSVAMPSLNSTYTAYIKSMVYGYYDLDNKTIGLKFPGGSYTYGPSKYYNITRYTYVTGNASMTVNETLYDWSYSVRGFQYYYNRLHTISPSITRSGRSRFLTGLLDSGYETAWYDLTDNSSALPLLTSGVSNTLTHNCSAYSDTYGGASGQLQFRIEYKWI